MKKIHLVCIDLAFLISLPFLLSSAQSTTIEDQYGAIGVSISKEFSYLRKLSQQQESTLNALTQQVRNLESAIAQHDNRIDAMSQVQRSTLLGARTCSELFRSDTTANSGFYYIDPDGWHSGDAAIYLYCDKATGESRLFHDSETGQHDYSSDGGYSRRVNYNVSMRQMRALTELSTACQQKIRYDCLNSPLSYSSWNDRRGSAQYYWAGNGTWHTCACGLNRTCLRSGIACNCDSAYLTKLYDEGFITNKDHLPVTHLNFGRANSYANSYGQHTLGPLQCSGSHQLSSTIPSSCADLWRRGVASSGMYQVRANGGKVVAVFCDMSKLPDEIGHETLIGISDVKSNPVYFTAVRESGSSALGIIPYQKALLNIGNAMNLQTGKFTAPKQGVYYFTLTLSSKMNTRAAIMHNGIQAVTLDTSDDRDVHGATAQATLELKAGDVVYSDLQLGDLFADSWHQTHFTGYLLQEL